MNNSPLKSQPSFILDTSSFFKIIDDYIITINALEPHRIKDVDGNITQLGDTKIPENIHVIRSIICKDTLKLYITRPHFAKEVLSYTKFAFRRDDEFFLMDSATYHCIWELKSFNPQELIDTSFKYENGCGIGIINGSSIIEYQVINTGCLTIYAIRYKKITDLDRAYWPIQDYDIEGEKQEVLGITYFDENAYITKSKKRIRELNRKFKVDPNYRIYKNAPKKYKYGKVRKIYDCKSINL